MNRSKLFWTLLHMRKNKINNHLILRWSMRIVLRCYWIKWSCVNAREMQNSTGNPIQLKNLQILSNLNLSINLVSFRISEVGISSNKVWSQSPLKSIYLLKRWTSFTIISKPKWGSDRHFNYTKHTMTWKNVIHRKQEEHLQ